MRVCKILALSWVFKGALLDILKIEASYIDNDKIMARLQKNINLELFSLYIASTFHHNCFSFWPLISFAFL